jgi:hypothetical protein
MGIAATSSRFDVARLQDLYAPDPERIARAKRRQAALWAGGKPDAWPIVFGGDLDERQREIPAPNLEEAFYDDELMLCAQIRAACRIANAPGDGVPSIRANLGTGVCLSCVGLAQRVFPDKMPWLDEHLTRAEVSKMTPDDITVRGDFARGLRQMRLFRQVMGDAIDVYCMDTQGPFDLAHLMIGDEIFYALYDDPPFVHHLMELALEIGIRTHTWMKEISGEPRTAIAHGNSIYAENMGVRICEDTTALIGRALMDEFVMPYTGRLAAHFGGAWVHYCGRNDHLTSAICECPEVRGLNFGIIPGRPFEHDADADMELITSKGKVYYGHWPRRKGESGRAYLRRLHGWASRGGLLSSNGNAALADPDGFGSAQEALDYWYAL